MKKDFGRNNILKLSGDTFLCVVCSGVCAYFVFNFSKVNTWDK